MQVILFDPGNFTPHYVENLGRALAVLNVKVELISSDPLFEDMAPNHPFPTHHLFFRSAGGRAKEFFRRHRLLRRGLKAVSYPLGLWRTWQAMKTRPPGIFHVHWALVPGLDAMLFRRLRSMGWRVVYTAHDMIAAMAHPRSRRQSRRIFRQTDAVVLHTSQLAETLRGQCGDVLREVRRIPEGTSTFPHHPHVDRNFARQTLGLSDGPLLLFFGMIKPYKGMEYLLRAWPTVLSEFPLAKLLIAGEPMTSFSSCERLIDRLNIRDAVVLKLAYVPRAETQYLFCAADAVVLPYVQISTSGVVSLAYRFARPVIATSIGGLPEIVKEGQTGFLVPPRSEAALAEAICRGFRHPSKLAAMGARGREWFEEERSWNEVARQTLDLYRSLLN